MANPDLQKKLILAGAAFGVGLLLILLSGFTGLQRAVWHAAGVFFVVVGLAAAVLTYAPIAPEPFGSFLRRPMLSIFLIALVAFALFYTVALGVFIMFMR